MFNQNNFDTAIAAIKRERLYQDCIWSKDFNDKEWTPAEWLLFIEKYVDKAKKGMPGCKNRSEGHFIQMDMIRKIAALCVAAMEHRGTISRTIPELEAEESRTHETEEIHCGYCGMKKECKS